MAIVFAMNEDAGELHDVINSAQSPHLSFSKNIILIKMGTTSTLTTMGTDSNAGGKSTMLSISPCSLLIQLRPKTGTYSRRSFRDFCFYPKLTFPWPSRAGN